VHFPGVLIKLTTKRQIFPVSQTSDQCKFNWIHPLLYVFGRNHLPQVKECNRNEAIKLIGLYIGQFVFNTGFLFVFLEN
jgi:hypothetical protein